MWLKSTGEGSAHQQKVHNQLQYSSCVFVILFFIVDHYNYVPVVQVLILCLNTKDNGTF